MKTLELILSLALIFSAAALIWHLMNFTGLLRSIFFPHFRSYLKKEGVTKFKSDIREEDDALVATLLVTFEDGSTVTREFLRADNPVLWNIRQFFFNLTFGIYRTVISCCAEHRESVEK